MPKTLTADTIIRPAGSLPLFSALALRMAIVVAVWDQRRRTRRALGQLSDHQLRDIGLSYGAATTEARRPFWQG